MSRRLQLHPMVKESLEDPRNAPSEIVLADWKSRTRRICKPCWELKYCPYGPLVEQFPLPPGTRKETETHKEYLRVCLRTGRLGNGEKLDEVRRTSFVRMLREDTSHLPTEIPSIMK